MGAAVSPVYTSLLSPSTCTSSMESTSIADGIENLCLDEELTAVVYSKLGATPKSRPPTSSVPESPVTPSSVKRPQRRRNRKDRRQGGVDRGEAGGVPRAVEGGVTEEVTHKHLTKVERLRSEGVQRSSSEIQIAEPRVPSISSPPVPRLILKSQSNLNINTGVGNLP